jgi:uncharacterized membrane protein (UPF0127 family)
MRLIHPASGKVLADELDVPWSFVGRGIGLMFRRPLQPGKGMLIDPCEGIHMLFMRFPIDALFLDRRDRVKKVYRNLPPWTGVVWYVWGARKVIELPAGTLDGLDLKPGEEMELAGI